MHLTPKAWAFFTLAISEKNISFAKSSLAFGAGDSHVRVPERKIMLFNSWIFPIFFVFVFSLYVYLPHRKQNLLLLAASYIFYGWWDWRFTLLLLISTIVDYNCGLAIHKNSSKRKLFLFISLATNLGILSLFKYFNFFTSSTERLLHCFEMEADFFTLSIILPVGISFYTFQTLAYTIDVYRYKIKPTKDIVSFAVYVAFFPQLVAGPIERATHLLPLIQKPRSLSLDMIYTAIPLILVGYFKKVFIADGVAPIVDSCFDSPSNYGGISLVFGVYLFALQIYGDFSGYTDIARGVSRLLGIELCLNFKQPYLSANITEFWRRWHMSLSSWLRDYLYFPLGGNRKGVYRTYVNLMLTMLIGGLWHGAGWTFIIWGGLHGLYLSVHKYILKGQRVGLVTMKEIKKSSLKYFINVFITFNLVCFAWVFFRASSMNSAISYIKHIFKNSFDFSLTVFAYFLFYGFFMIAIDFLSFNKDAETPFEYKLPEPIIGIAYGLMILLLFTIGNQDAKPFIYFQF